MAGYCEGFNEAFMMQNCRNECQLWKTQQPSQSTYYSPPPPPPTYYSPPTPQPTYYSPPPPPAPLEPAMWETRHGKNCFTIAPGGKEVVLSVGNAIECQQQCLSHNEKNNGHELEKCVSAVFIQNKLNNKDNCYLKGFHVGKNTQKIKCVPHTDSTSHILKDAVKKDGDDHYKR
jgi:hypothetical protein